MKLEREFQTLMIIRHASTILPFFVFFKVGPFLFVLILTRGVFFKTIIIILINH